MINHRLCHLLSTLSGRGVDDLAQYAHVSEIDRIMGNHPTITLIAGTTTTSERHAFGLEVLAADDVHASDAAVDADAAQAEAEETVVDTGDVPSAATVDEGDERSDSNVPPVAGDGTVAGNDASPRSLGRASAGVTDDGDLAGLQDSEIVKQGSSAVDPLYDALDVPEEAETYCIVRKCSPCNS